MARMKAPSSGVRVRMYRQGQGDCFLLAFPRQGGTQDNPVYLLIDCGYMYGSQFDDIDISDVIEHIVDSTGGRIDFVAITHEHADHVNGFNKTDGNGNRLFDKIEFGQLWLAWTEDGDDDFANQLRAYFGDELIALAQAETRMADDAVPLPIREELVHLLELELGEPAERTDFIAGLDAGGLHGFGAAGSAFAIEGISNKKAIKYLRDNAADGIKFLRPAQPAFEISGASGARTYVLGPPRDKDLLLSLDPRGEEEFHMDGNLALGGEAAAFSAAFSGNGDGKSPSPFAKRYSRPASEVSEQEVAPPPASDAASQVAEYNARYYFEADSPIKTGSWRRIDHDWLRAAGALALRMNHEVNNTSLVLAFELPDTGKVLLFTGDAQRGNWISWSDLEWQEDTGLVTARDLLGRCVFYKCGHHGSHNATLDGTLDSDYANLGWFAQGEFAKAFTAMVPVHSKWAKEKNNWNHPLPGIEEALVKKARGRVFRNDRSRVRRTSDAQLTDEEWQEFKDLSVEGKLYKEYIVLDK